MNEQEILAFAQMLAQLLQVLLPLGVKVYTAIQQAHSDKLAPIETLLQNADTNWQKIIDTANQG